MSPADLLNNIDDQLEKTILKMESLLASMEDDDAVLDNAGGPLASDHGPSNGNRGINGQSV